MSALESPTPSDPQLRALCRAEALDAYAACGWLRYLPAPALTGLLQRPLDRFVARLAGFDAQIARVGLAGASRWALAEWSAELTVVGGSNLPPQGPLLIASNHPGVADSVAMLAQLAGQDVRILAAERPFFGALPALCRHLIVAPESRQARAAAIRRAAQHLRSGGVLLTYPAGAIEPDPAVRLPDALAMLHRWSASADWLLRMVPELIVLPVIVSGVIGERYRDHWLARGCAGENARDWLAATRQVLARQPQEIRPVLRIGAPLSMRWGEPVHGSLLAEIARLLAQSGDGSAGTSGPAGRPTPEDISGPMPGR